MEKRYLGRESCGSWAGHIQETVCDLVWLEVKYLVLVHEGSTEICGLCPIGSHERFLNKDVIIRTLFLKF